MKRVHSQARAVPFSALPPNLPNSFHETNHATASGFDFKFHKFEAKFDKIVAKIEAKFDLDVETDTLRPVATSKIAKKSDAEHNAKIITEKVLEKLDQVEARMQAKLEAKIDAKFGELLAQLKLQAAAAVHAGVDNSPSKLALLAKELEPSTSTFMALEICGYVAIYAVLAFGFFACTQVIQGKRYNWDK
jgi:hypothetical protein